MFLLEWNLTPRTNNYLFVTVGKITANIRKSNIEVLLLFRFFITDIYRQLKDKQLRSSVRVYRGQLMSDDELKRLQSSRGRILSVNSFFSTSKNLATAESFLNRYTNSSQARRRVLFIIDADPNAISLTPYADITDCSANKDEREVLFMIGSVFRLNTIQQANDNGPL